MSKVSRATLAASLAALFADNTSGDISPADARSLITDCIDSLFCLLSDLVPNAQTGTSYTLVLTDSPTGVTLDNASAIALTIPTNATVAFPVGTEIPLIQLGAGQVTVAGAGGVTLNARGSAYKLAGQYAPAMLKKIATDTWILTGDITA